MAVQSVLLKTPLTANTGYGNDGFSLSRAFYQAGLDIRLAPTAVGPPLPMGVAQLLVKPLDIQFDFFVHHVDPANLGLSPSEKRMQAKKIAWSMWEFTTLSPEIQETFTKQLEGYDLLFAYDEISYQAFLPHCEEAGVPIKILQGGYWAEDWQYDHRLRDWDGPFRFCMVGQLHQRKNPHAAVRAFEEVHAEFPDTELHLKNSLQTLHPAMEDRYPGLKIHYTMWSHEELKSFYGQCHTYVAPSWGEGKNLPALEALTMGIPAIYSDFGGHRQWGSSDVGWPVPGKIEEHVPGMGSMRVDHDSLVAAMREAVQNRSATKHKGELASRIIPSMCDWNVVVRRFLDKVH